MGVDNFSNFQSEIEKKKFKNPQIKFGFQSIKIITLPYFNDILLQIFFGFISIFFLFESSMLFFGLLFIVVFLYFFYVNFIGLNICTIDLITKTLVFKNRIFIFNITRKIFGIKTEIDFSEIKAISYKQGQLLSRFPGGGWESRCYLLIDTYKNPGVIISQFKIEDDVENMVSYINKLILNKKNIA